MTDGITGESNGWQIRDGRRTGYRHSDAGWRDTAREFLSSESGGEIPRADDLRSLRQRRAAEGVHDRGLGHARKILSGDPASLVLQASRLRDARSRMLRAR